MLQPLASVLRTKREEAGVLQVDVAARAGISRPAVTRFETRQIIPEIGLDTLVDAYAAECGVEWLELWELTLVEARTR
jgi:transcriptional regulator with XRE-family HTH domain